MADRTYTAFEDMRLLARGAAADVAAAARAARQARPETTVLIFDDATGWAEDFDLSLPAEHIAARVAILPPAAAPRTAPPPQPAPRGRGRPRLGVTPREVTLLPRHWDWLAAQPGGASAALRRLVEDARKANAGKDRQRRAREAAYGFMSGLAGDLPGFEEAARSLFRGDMEGLKARIADWPPDVRAHVLALADAN